MRAYFSAILVLLALSSSAAYSQDTQESIAQTELEEFLAQAGEGDLVIADVSPKVAYARIIEDGLPRHFLIWRNAGVIDSRLSLSHYVDRHSADYRVPVAILQQDENPLSLYQLIKNSIETEKSEEAHDLISVQLKNDKPTRFVATQSFPANERPHNLMKYIGVSAFVTFLSYVGLGAAQLQILGLPEDFQVQAQLFPTGLLGGIALSLVASRTSNRNQERGASTELQPFRKRWLRVVGIGVSVGFLASACAIAFGG